MRRLREREFLGRVGHRLTRVVVGIPGHKKGGPLCGRPPDSRRLLGLSCYFMKYTRCGWDAAVVNISIALSIVTIVTHPKTIRHTNRHTSKSFALRRSQVNVTYVTDGWVGVPTINDERLARHFADLTVPHAHHRAIPPCLGWFVDGLVVHPSLTNVLIFPEGVHADPYQYAYSRSDSGPSRRSSSSSRLSEAITASRRHGPTRLRNRRTGTVRPARRHARKPLESLSPWAPDKFNSASRDGWEVVTAQFIPSGDAVGRIGIFALLRRALAGPNTQVD